jgi:putative drug exporter of the RND superfamily
MRYPVQVLIPVFLLLITLGLPFSGVRFSAPDASILPADEPSRAAFDLLARRFNDRETTPVLIAVQTEGDVLSADNIRKLYAYVQRIQADPRVARVDSIVSADSRFTLDQYELLYTHPQLIADPYLSALVKATVAGNTMEMPGRVTYIIDRQGIVRRIFFSQFTSKRHVDEALETLQKIHEE